MAKSNNKKMRLKPLPVAIMVILAVVIIVAFIVAEIHNSQKEEDSKKANVSLSEKELVAKGEVNVNIQNDAVKTEVEILFEDSAVPVGTSFKIMAIVTPSDTDKAIVWTSSNSDIVEVSSDGVINVKGIGTAAITATVGDVADAIAIEGIASVTSGSGNGYSVYTGSSVNSAGNTASGISSSGESGDSYNGSTSGNQSSGNTGSSGADSASGGGTGSSGADSTSGGGTGSSGADSTSGGGTGSSGADSTSGGGTGNSGAGSSSGGNSSDTSKGLTSSEISGVLTEQGFTPNVSNVYVYNDNGTYCGEIVIQPNVTIIYIKQRSSGFDSKIQSVLKELLPTEYNQVWNNYLSATTDRTFTVENRKVRLVTAGKGGHSQIVIYN